jgi:hypothetical protein
MQMAPTTVAPDRRESGDKNHPEHNSGKTHSSKVEDQGYCMLLDDLFNEDECKRTSPAPATDGL